MSARINFAGGRHKCKIMNGPLCAVLPGRQPDGALILAVSCGVGCGVGVGTADGCAVGDGATVAGTTVAGADGAGDGDGDCAAAPLPIARTIASVMTGEISRMR